LIVVLMAWVLADLAGRVVPGVDEAAEACQLWTCPGRASDLSMAPPVVLDCAAPPRLSRFSGLGGVLGVAVQDETSG
jgi:hypothetical protein